MKKPNGYLTTGEFAKVCQVNKQTLFHYDQVGILRPEITGANGYRYYSYLQLDTFNAISMLKALDMPLAEIKEFLNKRSPEKFLKLLKEQSNTVDAKISELQWLKRFIEGRITITNEGISSTHGKIFMETRPEEHYIITEYHGVNEDPDIYATIAEHHAYCHEHQIYSPYAVGGLIDINGGPWSDTYSYSHFFTKVPPEELSESVKVTTFPQRTYISVCSTRGFKAALPLLEKLLKYADEHNFKTGPYVFEDMLLDDMSCFGFDNYTLKLSLPVIE